MQVKIKKLHPDAVVPSYAKPGDACFDIVAIDDGRPHPKDSHAAIYRTGLAIEVPPGWGLKIYSRSGQGFNEAVRLSNSVGIIDSGYRGEFMVSLRFDGDDDLRCKKYRAGDRICQAAIEPMPQVEFVVVDELSDSERGQDGFGSTGQ